MDKGFFIQQMEEQSEMLYRIAYSILRHEEDCKDAMQDTALKAWEKRNTLRNLERFRPWVTRILVNCCYDRIKKRKRCIPMDTLPESTSPPPDPGLALALHQLPEKLRLPLVLCYSEGMSYQEIAEVLRLPISTIRNRIYRGKDALRKELEAE